jgi:hypothetical protein
MRTTIDLPDELFRQVKKRAADDGATMRRVIEEAIRRHVAAAPVAPAYRFHWRVERGTLQPGVRLDDRDALFDLMEGRR